jgi:hypothetical protein
LRALLKSVANGRWSGDKRRDVRELLGEV